MVLFARHPTLAGLQQAKQLAENLVQTVSVQTTRCVQVDTVFIMQVCGPRVTCMSTNVLVFIVTHLNRLCLVSYLKMSAGEMLCPVRVSLYLSFLFIVLSVS